MPYRDSRVDADLQPPISTPRRLASTVVATVTTGPVERLLWSTLALCIPWQVVGIVYVIRDNPPLLAFYAIAGSLFFAIGSMCAGAYKEESNQTRRWYFVLGAYTLPLVALALAVLVLLGPITIVYGLVRLVRWIIHGDAPKPDDPASSTR